ncbi:S-adenosyl-L-methionine-dependent methyltransferase [Piedraia hortae CBS 480.64]|uniref:S-adenosyl-L-methionine-dependent methyltransferase n=1 Tax=Piedraia hortae CBS 480.64 TaxID=1314780 RepID=A0A6A7BY55_9PEZI|nr:S-adenosyl-L-methionine-dependent methyltransferase [Piedraia hortae CBS 480.64]
MALYTESSTILCQYSTDSSSLKSLIFSHPSHFKTSAKRLYALCMQTLKFSSFLSTVITASDLLTAERSLSPTIALVLLHDHFFSSTGLSLSAEHKLRKSIERHKARLHGEFVRARLARGCTDLETLCAQLDKDAASHEEEVRWIRVNSLKTTLEQELKSTFKQFKETDFFPPAEGKVFVDPHVPNLVAVPSVDNITSWGAYKTGRIILQNKASCFPVCLMDQGLQGDCIDACAAPGNKTTHLAATLGAAGKVFACERDEIRSGVLKKMVALAGATNVEVLGKTDFLTLEPEKWPGVNAILLDPSCSGSGMLGREGKLTLHLPVTAEGKPHTKGKKRKREPTPAGEVEQDDSGEALATRLSKLSSFQSRIVEHAMKFPSVKHIVYSTCSVHQQENEDVVMAVLNSKSGKDWRLLKRDEQVLGMRNWPIRGLETAFGDRRDLSDACMRCNKGVETMGFFVAAFVRRSQDDEKGEEEWAGFVD